MCMPPAPGIFSFSSSYSPPQFPSPPRSSLSLFFLLPCLGRGPPTFALSLRLSTLLPFAAGFRRSLQSMRGYTGCYRNTRPNFRTECLPSTDSYLRLFLLFEYVQAILVYSYMENGKWTNARSKLICFVNWFRMTIRIMDKEYPWKFLPS